MSVAAGNAGEKRLRGRKMEMTPVGAGGDRNAPAGAGPAGSEPVSDPRVSPETRPGSSCD